LSGLEFVARIGIERDKDKPDDTGRNVIKAALGADHAEYARVMGSVPQPPQQGQFTASGPKLTDNGMGQSGACVGDSGGPLIIDGSSGQPEILGTLRRGEETCLGLDYYIRADRFGAWVVNCVGSPAASRCESVE